MLDVIVQEPVVELCEGVEYAFDVDSEESGFDTLVCKELEVVSADGVGYMVAPDIV